MLIELLRVSKEAGLELNYKKCKFAGTELVYLGYKISKDGIRPSDAHIEAIRNYPMPKTFKENQRCHGLFSYFCRFVPNFATVAKPISAMLGDAKQFKWTAAFEFLREKLVSSPVLAVYDSKRGTEVHCDASSYGFGATLMQKQDDGKFHPIAYYSKKTTEDDTKLISFELETLAIVYALERFETFLDRMPFTVVTPVGRYYFKVSIVNFNIERAQR